MHEKHGVVRGEGDEPETPVKQAADTPGVKNPVGTDLMSKMARQAATKPIQPGGTPQGPVEGK